MAITETIESLIKDIERGQYFLPEFQRGFRWTPEQVKQYLQSLYREYPTGSFLVWKAKLPSKVKGVADGEKRRDTRLLLDGQQRLTSLYTLLRGSPPHWIEGKAPRIDLYFNVSTEEFQYFAPQKMEGNPEWVSVSNILQHGAIDSFFEIKKRYTESSKDVENEKLYLDRLNNLEKIKKYEYYIQIVDYQDPRQVIEIFNLVNSAGTPLSNADLSLALITGRWEECKDEMRRAIAKYQGVGFEFDMDFFTRAIAVICTSRGVFDEIPKQHQSDFIEAWQKIEKSLDYLVHILPQHAYIDETSFLSTRYIFFPLIYYIAHNNFKFPDSQTRDKFIYWAYNALMWGRYSGSSESVLDFDIRTLKETNSVDELIKNIALSRGGNLMVSEDDLELQGVRSRLYQIFYILIRHNDAADWADSSLPLYNRVLGKKYAIERHHIFPKSKLYKFFNSKASYDKKVVNELANIALITSATNHQILNNDPEIYLQDIEQEQLRRQFVPLDQNLWKMNREAYLLFVKERRRLLADGINQFLNGLYTNNNQIHVSRDVEQWRRKIEEIEKSLRGLIIDIAIENEDDIDPAKYIPSHFASKLESKIKRHLRDNPSDSYADYNSLAKKIDFFDLSEYCDLMLTKDNWPYFEPYFGQGNKSALQQRFSQLQAMRNAIAHNRELADVVIKEGEAAILWLSEALRKYILTN